MNSIELILTGAHLTISVVCVMLILLNNRVAYNRTYFDTQSFWLAVACQIPLLNVLGLLLLLIITPITLHLSKRGLTHEH